MSRRFLSLYYGSIGLVRALEALWCWLAGFFVSAAQRRQALAQTVREYFPHAAVFAFGSGRSALAACLKAAGIGPGDEVLVSSYSCLAVPTAVIATGAKPVYMDINPETLNVDMDTVNAALSSRVRAVVVQHTLGKVAPIQSIVECARNRNVLVIEDCALAVGSSIDGRDVGTFGDAAIFSMELSKTVSCGWGGILLVNDRELAAAVTAYYATLPEPGRWSSTRDLWQTVISALCNQPALYDTVGKYVLYLGFKIGLFRRSTPRAEFDGVISSDFIVKLSGTQVAFARLQWRNVARIAASCDSHANELRRVLRELNFSTPGVPEPTEISITPRVSFLVNNRREASAYFLDKGIELGQWFDGPMSPVPTAPRFNYRPGTYPHAERVARSVVNLPCHSRITAADLDHMVTTLREFVRDCPGCPVRDS